jgi:hypothetical protein
LEFICRAEINIGAAWQDLAKVDILMTNSFHFNSVFENNMPFNSKVMMISCVGLAPSQTGLDPQVQFLASRRIHRIAHA